MESTGYGWDRKWSCIDAVLMGLAWRIWKLCEFTKGDGDRRLCCATDISTHGNITCGTFDNTDSHHGSTQGSTTVKSAYFKCSNTIFGTSDGLLPSRNCQIK